MSDYSPGWVTECARNHTERKTALNPDPPLALAAPGKLLCHECIERLRWRLREIPELIGHIRDLSVPGLQSSLGGGPKVDRSREWSEPFNRSASEDADGLWASLAYFAQRAGREFGVRAPGEVGWQQAQGILTGADHHVTKAGAQRVVDWLTSWLDDITATALGEFMHDDLVPLVGKLRSRYGFTSSVRRAAPRPCASCGETEVRVSWDRESPRVQCAGCMFVQPVSWEVIAGAFDVADVSAGR